MHKIALGLVLVFLNVNLPAAPKRSLLEAENSPEKYTKFVPTQKSSVGNATFEKPLNWQDDEKAKAIITEFKQQLRFIFEAAQPQRNLTLNQDIFNGTPDDCTEDICNVSKITEVLEHLKDQAKAVITQTHPFLQIHEHNLPSIWYQINKDCNQLMTIVSGLIILDTEEQRVICSSLWTIYKSTYNLTLEYSQLPGAHSYKI